jgi:hypothetical protein
MSKFYKLSEVADITEIKLETLRTDSKRGFLPTQLIQEKQKTVKVITAETLALLLQKKDSGSYADLKLMAKRNACRFAFGYLYAS